VATVASVRSPELGRKNIPWLLIAPAWLSRFSMKNGMASAR
jgi:hypothetical protein